MSYGIEVPGGFGLPAWDEAGGVISRAVDSGINLFDTAPSYGRAEEILGTVLKGARNLHLATKVPVPSEAEEQITAPMMRELVRSSVHESLRRLRRDVLDIVQIHNATPDLLARGDMTVALEELKAEGKILHLGASVYGTQAALAVIDSGRFEILQVAYNLLDQRMSQQVFPRARQAEMGILVRSVFLKGVLTDKAAWLPAELDELKKAAENACHRLETRWADLPEMALRFCLSSPEVGSVLLGVRNQKELQTGLQGAASGPLSPALLERTGSLSLREERLLNPSYWPVP
jgi:aryl-alcohol dehydrogenase-like predicted oxidoreductase